MVRSENVNVVSMGSKLTCRINYQSLSTTYIKGAVISIIYVGSAIILCSHAKPRHAAMLLLHASRNVTVTASILYIAEVQYHNEAVQLLPSLLK